MTETPSSVGIVVIGRNEGTRLDRCLRRLFDRADSIVYVDSGSTDGSVELARSRGVDVVELDLDQRFTAGRARNAGLRRLLTIQPDVARVQFLDGDCELADGWMERAEQELAHADDLAIVCGRRRERCPEASRYNLFCDIEWDGPVGQVEACGGDFMARVNALREVGGFSPDFIAGEEPELCLRLRESGWRIWRIDAEMTLHDAAISSFSQWWARAIRAGHACAQTTWVHPMRSGWLGTRSALSIALWAAAIPLSTLTLAWPSGGFSLLLLGAYPMQWARITRSLRRHGRTGRESRSYAAFVLIGRFAQARGALQFLVTRLMRRSSKIIEYKGPATDG